MSLKRGSAARRKTISRSDLESFLCEIDDAPTPAVTNDENTINTLPQSPKQEKKIPEVADVVEVDESPTVDDDNGLDIAHAVRQFCRVSTM